MKLRNKKTGEIGEFTYFADKVYVLVNNELKTNLNYTSLAKLNKEWEDYEEPKECDYWYIEVDGKIIQCHKPSFMNNEILKSQKQFGNYFETEEEAEKTLEKLKAWKRLKDDGFEFTGWDRHPDFEGDFRITASDEYRCNDKDLDLLFGGEE